MTIVVNGENIETVDNCTITQLLEILELSMDKIMACAVDSEIVKKEDWNQKILTPGKKVELLNFVGGG